MATELNADPVAFARRSGLWVLATHWGTHGDTSVVALTTRDEGAPLPYGWHCICGISQNFPTEYGVARSAWRHVHPPRWRTRARRTPLLGHLIQPTARLQHPRI